MGAMGSQIDSLTIVYSAVWSGADQRKHQSSASLAFVWGIHRSPVNSSHKGPVTRKMFPFDDVIMGNSPMRYCHAGGTLSSMTLIFENMGNVTWYARCTNDKMEASLWKKYSVVTGVSNHRQLRYLLNSFFSLSPKKTSELRLEPLPGPIVHRWRVDSLKKVV